VVSATNPHGRNLGFLDLVDCIHNTEIYFKFKLYKSVQVASRFKFRRSIRNYFENGTDQEVRAGERWG
jgi:hypothetical protein